MSVTKYNTRGFGIIIAILFGIGIVSVSFSPITAKEKKPNILLITVDSLRSDHLGCYGYKKDISPNIDRLAREGVLFTQAIAQATWTAPSLHSIMSATYPSTHGINSWNAVISKSLPSLPDLLKRAGKYTTCFMTQHGRFQGMRTGGIGFARGFDDIVVVPHKAADTFTDEALSWISKNKEQPFFLWLHYMDIHDGHLGLSPNRDLAMRYRRDICVNIYDDKIKFIDSNIGRIVEKLKEFGLYKDTVIIISADHGAQIDEHMSFFRHSGSPWEVLIRVPLVIVYPALSAGNKVIEQQVELIDIAPTVCDIAGIKMARRYCEGISFYPILKGKSIPSKKFTFSEVIFLNIVDMYRETSIRTEDWKLIYINFFDPPQEEYMLYSLTADPQEKNNLADKEKLEFILLKRELEKWMARRHLEVNPLIELLNEEAKENLRELGYLE